MWGLRGTEDRWEEGLSAVELSQVDLQVLAQPLRRSIGHEENHLNCQIKRSVGDI